jgi:hypothetical protein
VIRGHSEHAFGGLKVEIQPERPFAEEIDAKDETPGFRRDARKAPEELLMSERTSRRIDIELGIRVQTIVSLAEQSYRTGK